jgi:hypothetical protein
MARQAGCHGPSSCRQAAVAPIVDKGRHVALLPRRANVAVAQDPARNLKPAKNKSTERIDGIVATIMAIGRAPAAQEEPQPEYSMFFV